MLLLLPPLLALALAPWASEAEQAGRLDPLGGIRPDGSCTLVTLLPFTERGSRSYERPSEDAYSQLAAALLAVEHFNARDGSVVPELSGQEFAPGIAGGCNVTFAPDSVFLDDEDWQSAPLGGILSALTGGGGGGGGVAAPPALRPCAIVGVQADKASAAAGVAAAALGVPYVTHASPNHDVGLSSFYPLTTRTAARASAVGEAIVSYVRDALGRDYLYVVHTGDEGEELAERVGWWSDAAGLTHRAVSPSFPFFERRHPASAWNAMRAVRASGFRTVVLAVTRIQHLYFIAEAAQVLGMLEPGEYVFVITPLTNLNMLDDPTPPVRRGDALDLMLRGAAALQPIETFDYDFSQRGVDDDGGSESESAFLRSWRSQGGAFVARVDNMYPIAHDHPSHYHAEPDHFQKRRPRRYSGFLYDAIIATGVGACRSLKAPAKDGDSNRPPERPPPPPGATPPPRGLPPPPRPIRNAHFDGILTAEFDGASGRVWFKNDSSGSEREKGTVAFGAFNVRPTGGGISGGWDRSWGGGDGSSPGKSSLARGNTTGGGANAANTTHGGEPGESASPVGGEPLPEPIITVGYDGVPIPEGERARFRHTLTSVYLPTGRTEPGGERQTRSWKSVGTFIFSSGTTAQPRPLRDEPEGNHLSPGVRAAGLALMSIGIAASCGSLAWVRVRRRESSVMASQPEFLYALCIGCAITCLTIVALSFDESYGSSVAQLDAFCMATPWLLGIGYIIVYSSLFCKLWRINRVLQMRRKGKVDIRKAFVPFAILILAAIIVLSVWTGVDSMVWDREVVNEYTEETIGFCVSDKSVPFFASLCAVMLVSMILTAVMAWITNDISDDFVETKWIFFAIFTQIQLLAIGIPVLALLGNGSTDVVYIVKVMLLWLFSVAMVGLIIGPKIWKVEGENIFGQGSTSEDDGTKIRGRLGTKAGVHITGLSNP